MTLSVLSQISTLAPKIEVLDVHVRNKAHDDWGQVCTLTSAMRSVDMVSKQRDGVDTGSLVLQGLPSDELTHLRIECQSLAIHHELYSWIMSRPNTNLIGFEAYRTLTDQKPVEQTQGECYEEFIRLQPTIQGQMGVLQCC